MACKGETVQLPGVSDCDWVRYIKNTGNEKSPGKYKVVTDVGLLITNDHNYVIENSGYAIDAVSSASDYGLQLYISPR